MARSEVSSTVASRRIKENSQSRYQQGHADMDDAAERILSRRTRSAKSVRQVKPNKSAPLTFAMALFKIIIVAGVVIGGIAIIIWLRNFAAANGIVWIGDQWSFPEYFRRFRSSDDSHEYQKICALFRARYRRC